MQRPDRCRRGLQHAGRRPGKPMPSAPKPPKASFPPVAKEKAAAPQDAPPDDGSQQQAGTQAAASSSSDAGTGSRTRRQFIFWGACSCIVRWRNLRTNGVRSATQLENTPKAQLRLWIGDPAIDRLFNRSVVRARSRADAPVVHPYQRGSRQAAAAVPGGRGPR